MNTLTNISMKFLGGDFQWFLWLFSMIYKIFFVSKFLWILALSVFFVIFFLFQHFVAILKFLIFFSVFSLFYWFYHFSTHYLSLFSPFFLSKFIVCVYLSPFPLCISVFIYLPDCFPLSLLRNALFHRDENQISAINPSSFPAHFRFDNLKSYPFQLCSVFIIIKAPHKSNVNKIPTRKYGFLVE